MPESILCPPPHSTDISVPSSAVAVQVSLSGWKASSTPRIAERGLRAPRASSPTLPKRRENTSTIRLVSLYG